MVPGYHGGKRAMPAMYTRVPWWEESYARYVHPWYHGGYTPPGIYARVCLPGYTSWSTLPLPSSVPLHHWERGVQGRGPGLSEGGLPWVGEA